MNGVFNVPYPDFDRQHLRVLLEQKVRLFPIILEQARRNPDRLHFLLNLTVDYIGCLFAHNQYDETLLEIFQTGTHIATAIFRLAVTPLGETLTVPFGIGSATYLRKRFVFNSYSWFVGFYMASIIRDRTSQEHLCAIPIEVICKQDNRHYVLDFIETLRAIYRQTPNAAQYLKNAQSLLTSSPYLSDGDEDEGDYALDLDNPILNLCKYIIENDYNGFQSTLVLALKLHKLFWRLHSSSLNSPTGLVALGPLAMSCFAYDRGVEIEVISDYLPQKLIKQHEKH